MKARERQEDFQLVLTRYALERLLFRLASSEHRDAFVLKGAMLFALWSGQPHRVTRDLDLLGVGDERHRARPIAGTGRADATADPSASAMGACGCSPAAGGGASTFLAMLAAFGLAPWRLGRRRVPR